MPPVLGVILAGGLARRMGGGDKPLRTLGGRTLLDRVLARFAPQCAAGVILNANGDPGRFPEFPGAIVPDGVPGNPGPLAGILAALDHAAAHHPATRHVASVSGDAPFLPLDLVARLAASAGRDDAIAMAASGGREHFTVALWPVALHAGLRAALVERGERRVGAFLRHHGAVAVSWPSEPGDPFANINAPEDLAAAEARLAGIERR
ncbi:molybdenum cofactor guanylyltransferase MobA [Methylobacterium sp. J-078]|uniref:molybdenum cofactor guanylyltransferase MobA n=1 Tax=Methylobacterium sp. J-078 TaxID=2836657 RepID=UPI001FB999F9|nr:molybdenum cofactor guanylyltransferase MobA [Methylobacterium sp. J-078]MCJ2047505.1 molybdenum cofactor guanylyltransferase MobA [Methylobacterium sp. J-078]